MFKLRVTVSLGFCVVVSACMPTYDYSKPPTEAQIAAIASNMGPTHTSKVYQSRADCAPDQADPVWWGTQLLGFSCYRASTRFF